MLISYTDFADAIPILGNVSNKPSGFSNTGSSCTKG
jgi:hypothetical protein